MREAAYSLDTEHPLPSQNHPAAFLVAGLFSRSTKSTETIIWRGCTGAYAPGPLFTRREHVSLQPACRCISVLGRVGLRTWQQQKPLAGASSRKQQSPPQVRKIGIGVRLWIRGTPKSQWHRVPHATAGCVFVVRGRALPRERWLSGFARFNSAKWDGWGPPVVPRPSVFQKSPCPHAGEPTHRTTSAVTCRLQPSRCWTTALHPCPAPLKKSFRSWSSPGILFL